jgi:hypothetical protein
VLTGHTSFVLHVQGFCCEEQSRTCSFTFMLLSELPCMPCVCTQVASTLGSNIREASESAAAAVEVVRREVLTVAAAKADKVSHSQGYFRQLIWHTTQQARACCC